MIPPRLYYNTKHANKLRTNNIHNIHNLIHSIQFYVKANLTDKLFMLILNASCNMNKTIFC